jgi:protein-S-isoprenylcysteine O-methyltransferase Ste14
VALIPKRALQSKSTAVLALAVSAVGLAVIPILTLPAMFLAGIGWSSGPRWTRVTLVLGAILFAAYLIAVKPGHAAQHS